MQPNAILAALTGITNCGYSANYTVTPFRAVTVDVPADGIVNLWWSILPTYS